MSGPTLAESTNGASRIRWLVFALASGTSWFLYLHRYSWNLISAELAREYGFSKTQLGGLYSFFNAAYAVGQIPCGLLSDLVGPHFFLGAAIIVWSLMVPCLGLSGSYRVLAGVQMSFGLAQAGGYPNVAKITRSWFPQRSRTIVQGFVATFFGRSGGAMSTIILGTVLMGWLELNWRAAILIMGAMGAAFGVLFLLLFRNDPAKDPRVNEDELGLIREGEIPVTDGPRVLPVRRALRNRSMLVFLFQQILNAGADTVFATYMGVYFLSRGVDIKEAGILISMPLWGGAVGGVLGGFCNDWLIQATGSRRWARSIMGFSGKFIACLLLLAAIRQESVYAAGLALFAVKFFSDWSQPTVWGTCTDLGGRYSATVFGILNTAGNIGGIIFPLAFGMILDYNTTQQVADGETLTVTNYTPMFTTVAAMYIIGATCWFAIDATQSLDREL